MTEPSVTPPADGEDQGDDAARPGSRASFGLPPRRRGRPSGPDRVALHVRVTLDVDALVTEIVDHTGAGPQEVVEEAVRRYAAALRRSGKLPKDPADAPGPGRSVIG
ncbi:hypothetical protein GXW82_44585 [Streptacidiphilus sp. 4-A2]|nr:hypothetical protein [Streptacidiphilus sp. 4-A2]